MEERLFNELLESVKEVAEVIESEKQTSIKDKQEEETKDE